MEVGNIYGLNAAAILHGGDVVGHVPRTISTPCNVFIRKEGVITCIISGHRQYSLDLEQGEYVINCLFDCIAKLSGTCKANKARTKHVKQTSINVLPSKNQALYTCKSVETLLILYLVYFRFHIIT